MSTHCFMYTEVNIDGQWVCINNKIKDTKKEPKPCATHITADQDPIFAQPQIKSRKSAVR